MKKLLLICLLLTSAQSFASDWQYVGGPTTASNYMDFASIGSVSGYRKAWVRVDYLEAQQTSGYPAKKFASAKFLYYFDCSGKLLATTQLVLYEKHFAEGEVVSSSSSKFDPKRLDDVVPDSVGENLLNVACSDSERTKIRAKNREADKQLQKYLDEAAKKAKEQNSSPESSASGASGA